jgi:K+-sensing histidine kinase KdpD
MVSHRGPQNRLHFGLGLYVVRIIAEYHGGFVRAINLADGSGVAITVQLPAVENPKATKTVETRIVTEPRARTSAG